MANESDSRREGLEAWAYGAFAVGSAAVVFFLILGSRPGGPLAVIVYRWGMLAVFVAALVGLLLSIVWSFLRKPVLQRGRWKPLSVLAATVWVTSYPFPYPSSHEGHPSPTSFQTPIAESFRVLFAGERAERDPLALDPARCFGLVLETSTENVSVRAPATGRLLAFTALDERLSSLGLEGARFLLQVRENEVLVLEGLAPDRLALPPGSEVGAGTILGPLAGNRLGVFLVDRATLDLGEGIPMRFSLQGGASVEPVRQALEAGQVLPGEQGGRGQR